MLSIGLRRDDWRSDTGGVILRLLLIAAVGAPLSAAVTGRVLATPFGVRLGVLASAAAMAGIAYAVWRMRWSGAWGTVRVVADAVALGTLATVFAMIIERTATGFYTDDVLADAMAVLLVLHLAGAALREVGLGRQRWPRLTVLRAGARTAAPDRTEPASMQFADSLTRGMALLVACFWGLAAIGFHEAAGVLLLLAGVSGTIVIVARVPSAFINERVLLHEWRRTRRTRHVGRPVENQGRSHVAGS